MTKLPRLGARAAVLSFVGVTSFSWSARAFPPQMLESDSADGAALALSPFPAPPGLQPAVRFWRDLFTQHASDRVVVHDRSNLDVVWRVVELPKKDDGTVDEQAGEKVVKAAVEDLKARLRRLAADPTAADDEDRILLSLAGNDPRRFDGACDRLRTQQGVADHFREGYARAQPWLDQVRQILAEEGVPTQMAALPFVESMFNPAARSYAGAVGVWQLMPATARDYGLKVQRGKGDERHDVMRSTRAAARLLRSYYRLLGSWPLALTGYNYGGYGLKRLCDRLGTTDLVTLIGEDEKAPIGFAARNFYAEFLAAMDVLSETIAANSSSSVRD